jgi:nucleoside-diphosphate-sugar epimerase
MEAWRATQEYIDVIIVNPGIIIGEGNWNSSSGQLITKTDSGNNYYTGGGSGFVDVRDVALAAQKLTESNFKNNRYILVSENKSYREVLDQIALRLQKPKPSIHLKSGVLKTLSYLLKIPNILGFQHQLTLAKVNSLTSKTKYSSAKIKKTIGLEFTPIQETIKRVTSFYKTRY